MQTWFQFLPVSQEPALESGDVGVGAGEGVNALAVTSPEVFQYESRLQTKSRLSYFKLEH